MLKMSTKTHGVVDYVAGGGPPPTEFLGWGAHSGEAVLQGVHLAGHGGRRVGSAPWAAGAQRTSPTRAGAPSSHDAPANERLEIELTADLEHAAVQRTSAAIGSAPFLDASQVDSTNAGTTAFQDALAKAKALIDAGVLHTTIVPAAYETYLTVLPELIATRLVPAGEPQYFTTPTPGSQNVPGALGLVEDTKFSHDRGFYTQPFALTITSATANRRWRASPPIAPTSSSPTSACPR